MRRADVILLAALLLVSVEAARPVHPTLSAVGRRHADTTSLVRPSYEASLMAAHSDAAQPYWNAERVHDVYNLMFTTAMAVLTISAFSDRAYNQPLAVLMCVYLCLDSIWLLLDPDGISGGTDGGGPRALLGHHALAFGVALHAATCKAHTRYTSWMTVVEMNTLILMLKKIVSRPVVINKVLNMLFLITWVATRLIWFPLMSFYVASMPGYPNLARRVMCAVAVFGLAALQIIWTYNFFVPPERQIPV